YLARAGLHRREGEAHRALLDLEQALSLIPEDPAALHERGLVLMTLGNDPEAALEDFDRSVARSPNDARRRVDRAVARWRTGDRKAALADLDRAIALDPSFALAFRVRASYRNELGRREESLADY